MAEVTFCETMLDTGSLISKDKTGNNKIMINNKEYLYLLNVKFETFPHI